MKRFFLLSLGLLLAVCVNAQSRVVSGIVTDATDGTTLPGVTVVVKGTTTGTITNADGEYSIAVDELAKHLVFSFMGMQMQEWPIEGGSINVALKADVVAVDEVMVVAYGTAKKSTYTGAVSTVGGNKLANAQVSSVSNALQGQVSGLQSVTTSGQPGEDATIRIRGIGSINAGSAPLYVLDGVAYDGALNALNPNDIESISVLKDAASASLYGSRGANGVIMITTKKGLKDTREPVINLKATHGISKQAVKPYEQLSTNQYFELGWEALKNGYMLNDDLPASEAALKASKNIGSRYGINPYGSSHPEPVGSDGRIVAGLNPLWDDSWEDALVGTGSRSEINLSVNGGSNKSEYYISGGFLNDKGIALESSFKRYTTRISASTQAKSWLKLGMNIGGTQSVQKAPKAEDSATSNVINASNSIPSFYPIYERNPATGDYLRDKNGDKIYDFGVYRSSSYANSNLVATQPLNINESKQYSVSMRTYAAFTFTKDLSFKTTYSYDYINAEGHSYNNPKIGPSAATGGYAYRDVNRVQSWTYNNVLSYDKVFNKKHSVNLLAGQEAYERSSLHLDGSKSHFALPDMSEPSAGGQLEGFDAYSNTYALLSVFGQAKYTYDEKYNASVSIREDGSSRFSPQSRWGTFWSAGASWNINKEDFMKNTPWVNSLILKASYGLQGNDQLNTLYAYQDLYSIETNNNKGALIFNRLENPNLKWESNINTNLGIEFALFNYRLKGGIDIYERKSKDLLFVRPLAPSSGLSGVTRNIGAMRNRGIDVDLNGIVIQHSHFEWTLGVNFTHYKNKVTELPEMKANEIGIRSGSKLLNVGHSIYDFYLREYAGVSKIDESVLTTATDSKQSVGGEPLWWYVDPKTGTRTKTNNYNLATEDYRGSALPDLYGGITNQFKIHQFTVNMLWAYSIGGKIRNQDNLSMFHTGGSAGATWSIEALNRWTPENQDTYFPRLKSNSYGNSWTSTSTAQLVDASYARLKNLSISYSVPSRFLNRLKISKADVFLQGENLITLFKTAGLDPEAASVGGETYFRYPAMKTMSVGINLSF